MKDKRKTQFVLSNHYNDFKWKFKTAEYNDVFDLSTIDYNEMCIKIVITNGSWWNFDFKSFTKDAIYNKYLNLAYSFIWDKNSTIMYKMLINGNTIKLYNCFINDTEYDKSYIVIYYR